MRLDEVSDNEEDGEERKVKASRCGPDSGGSEEEGSGQEQVRRVTVRHSKKQV